MLEGWPDEGGLAREILLAEQEGDKITHEIVQRVNTTFVTPIDGGGHLRAGDAARRHRRLHRGDRRLHGPLPDRGADGAVAGDGRRAGQVAASSSPTALEHLRGFKDLEQYWIEIHRLENEGDRLYRDAVASLFANGIDPMFVIRWRDIFLRLERAVDATETAAHILEGIVIKNACYAERRRCR